ncbi:MAG: CYTH domain-containing protein [Cyanobacteria bacterium J06607_13]
MPQEIERKFLVASDRWRDALAARNLTGQFYCQGYIATVHPGQSVRLRIVGEQGYLTIKGPTEGLSRAEFEYDIPVDDARELLETLCDRPFIEKIRYRLPIDNLVWEIDEFQGDNAGLVIAEVELTSAGQTVSLPDWVGKEVSGDVRYYNSSLVKRPYGQWK